MLGFGLFWVFFAFLSGFCISNTFCETLEMETLHLTRRKAVAIAFLY